MSQAWYVRHNHKTYGPFTPGKLKQLAGSAKISRATEVRLGESGKWMLAARVTGLFTSATVKAEVAVKHRAGSRHELTDAFRTIWFQPRVTIRWLIDERDPREAILLIAIVFGIEYLDNVLAKPGGLAPGGFEMGRRRRTKTSLPNFEIIF